MVYKGGIALIVAYVLVKILGPLCFNVTVRRAVDKILAERDEASISPTTEGNAS